MKEKARKFLDKILVENMIWHIIFFSFAAQWFWVMYEDIVNANKILEFESIEFLVMLMGISFPLVMIKLNDIKDKLK